VLIGVVLYVLLDIAFIGSLSPSHLVHGWSNPIGKGAFGPFASIATGLGITWLAVLLYIDSFVSPAGTGLVYTATSSRVLYALGRNRYVPNLFEGLNRNGVPLASLIMSFGVGLLLLLPFPGWQRLVGFITSATALMYAFAPLSLAALRSQDPEQERPYRLRQSKVLAPLSFIGANLIFYWAGWDTDWRLLVAVVLGFLLAGITYVTRPASERPAHDLTHGWWVFPWLAGMGAISYVGQFSGGRKLLPFWFDLLTVAGFSGIIYAVALKSKLSPEQARQYIAAADQGTRHHA
jgi:amino acid transporter